MFWIWLSAEGTLLNSTCLAQTLCVEYLKFIKKTRFILLIDVASLLPRDRWIPRTKGQLCGKCFHLMTSSCADALVIWGYGHKFVHYFRIYLVRRTIRYNDVRPGIHWDIESVLREHFKLIFFISGFRKCKRNSCDIVRENVRKWKTSSHKLHRESFTMQSRCFLNFTSIADSRMGRVQRWQLYFKILWAQKWSYKYTNINKTKSLWLRPDISRISSEGKHVIYGRRYVSNKYRFGNLHVLLYRRA